MNENRSMKTDTVDFIFEYTKEAPERQLQDAAALDSKVLQVFSVASVVIGLIGIWGIKIRMNPFEIAFLIAAVGAYVFVAGFTIFQIKAKSFHRSSHADSLWQDCWNREIMEIKHSLIADISKTYGYNKTIIKDKTCTLTGALFAMAVEIICIGVFILISSQA